MGIFSHNTICAYDSIISGIAATWKLILLKLRANRLQNRLRAALTVLFHSL